MCISLIACVPTKEEDVINLKNERSKIFYVPNAAVETALPAEEAVHANTCVKTEGRGRAFPYGW